MNRSILRTRATLAAFAALSWCWIGACDSPDETDVPPESETRPDASVDAPTPFGDGHWGDPFEGLPSGEEQLARVCESGRDDMVHRLFCGDEPPELTSLHDLQVALGLEPERLGGVSGSALVGHSTSLSARSTSAINPRAILFRLVVPLTDDSAPPIELVALAFTRGEQFVELAVMDGTREFAFYLVRFEQDCNERDAGCTPGDLLTEAVERDWRTVSLYDEASLENTVLDCATCHQPGGPGTNRMLRMQEFEPPWTHWFFSATAGGSALVDDYAAAKGDESVAGLRRKDIGAVSPGGLQLFVSGRDHFQPNPFLSAAIEREVVESAAADGGDQPADNSVPGTSPTWREAYERAQRGESIPVPYHDVKVTDPAKLARMSDAYRAYQRGELSRDELPDLRDVLPDSHALLAEMGMSTEPGLSGEAVLMQACAQCHNDRLNQELSRARFRADLQGLTRAEKDMAIARLLLPPNDVLAMPPARLRVLSKEARARAIAALRE